MSHVTSIITTCLTLGQPTPALLHCRTPVQSLEMLIEKGLDSAQHFHAGIIVERQHLHEHNTRNLPLRIDPEMRVIDTPPTQASGTTVLRIPWVCCGNLKSQSELVVSGAHWKRPRSD